MKLKFLNRQNYIAILKKIYKIKFIHNHFYDEPILRFFFYRELAGGLSEKKHLSM